MYWSYLVVWLATPVMISTSSCGWSGLPRASTHRKSRLESKCWSGSSLQNSVVFLSRVHGGKRKLKKTRSRDAAINSKPAGRGGGGRQGMGWGFDIFLKFCRQISYPWTNHSSQMHKNFFTPGKRGFTREARTLVRCTPDCQTIALLHTPLPYPPIPSSPLQCFFFVTGVGLLHSPRGVPCGLSWFTHTVKLPHVQDVLLSVWWDAGKLVLLNS